MYRDNGRVAANNISAGRGVWDRGWVGNGQFEDAAVQKTIQMMGVAANRALANWQTSLQAASAISRAALLLGVRLIDSVFGSTGRRQQADDQTT